MVRGYRWMYRTARPAIDMSTMPGRGCIFHDIGNYPSRDHDTRKYHLSFGGACQTPSQRPTTTHFSLSLSLSSSRFSLRTSAFPFFRRFFPCFFLILNVLLAFFRWMKMTRQRISFIMYRFFNSNINSSRDNGFCHVLKF